MIVVSLTSWNTPSSRESVHERSTNNTVALRFSHDEKSGQTIPLTDQILLETIQTEYVTASFDAVLGENGRNRLDEVDDGVGPYGFLLREFDFGIEDINRFFQDSRVVFKRQGGKGISGSACQKERDWQDQEHLPKPIRLLQFSGEIRQICNPQRIHNFAGNLQVCIKRRRIHHGLGVLVSVDERGRGSCGRVLQEADDRTIRIVDDVIAKIDKGFEL